MIWKGSTYVELSWLQGDQQNNLALSSSISGAVLDQNNVSYIVSVESEMEESCFLTVCLSALGIIDREIVQKSIFRIICTLSTIQFKEICLSSKRQPSQLSSSNRIHHILSFRPKLNWESILFSQLSLAFLLF